MRRQRVSREPLDIHGRADSRLHRRHLARHLVHLDRRLGEDRAGAFLAVGDRIPLAVEIVALRNEHLFLEQPQLVIPVTQKEALEDRLEHRIRVHWDRNGDAEAVADRAVLSQQDVEHDAVDLVVEAVVHEHAHLVSRLPVAVDPALALLVPGGVPAQVVVDDRVEAVLEVDAFTQAIRGDEDAARRVRKLVDATLAIRSRHLSGYSDDLDVLADLAA